MGPCVGDVTFFNHVGQLGPHVDDVTSTHEKPTKNMKNWFAWFFKVVSWFFMVFGWFRWFFKVVSWFFHGFWLVSMVFHGSRLVFHGFSPECPRRDCIPA